MCYSDYDGDELCATVVVDTWNPAGVHMPTVFSTPQSILAAIDDLAIQFNILISANRYTQCEDITIVAI